MIWISDFFLKIFFNSKGDNNQLLFSKDDLGHYINEQMEGVEDHNEIDSEVQIFQNALDFSKLKSRDIMIPRIELAALEIHDYISNLKSLFISEEIIRDSGLSFINFLKFSSFSEKLNKLKFNSDLISTNISYNTGNL